MNFRYRFLTVLLACGLALPGPDAVAQTAAEIVAKADAVRNPHMPFSLVDTLTEYRSGRPQDSMVLTVFSKEDAATGQFRSLVRFDAPARDQGKLMLKNGNILWFYDSASRASVRISPQERLLGQASNGDVVTVNYAKDYDAQIATEETIADADRKNHDCWRLAMTANTDSVTYFRIDYWVEKASFRPIKGRYFSDSGRLLKTVYFRRYRLELGAERPTEAIIIDGVDTQLVTRMEFESWQARTIPEDWFQRDYLPRFKTQ